MKSFGEYVNSLPWAEGELDNCSYKTFLRAASLGVAPDEALNTVAHRIRNSGDFPRIYKLRTQITRAYDFARADSAAASVAGIRLPRPIKPTLTVNPANVEHITRHVPAITPQWLRARSPRPVLAVSPVCFLDCCYHIGEHVVILTDPRSDGFLWQNWSIYPNWNALDKLRYGHQGVWYMIQPVDGQAHWNPRQQRDSKRSEEAVTSWRYAILESDKVPPAEWLKILVQLPLPIHAIYSSGGESVHALVRIDAESKERWDQIMRRKLLRILAPLGADPGALTAVRLSRLPNCMRAQTGELQELYYLNPKPEAEPLL
jgi:hypothetical protein